MTTTERVHWRQLINMGDTPNRRTPDGWEIEHLEVHRDGTATVHAPRTPRGTYITDPDGTIDVLGDDTEPHPIDLTRELREALGLFAGAMPCTPKQAWDEAINVVKALASGRCWMCMARDVEDEAEAERLRALVAERDNPTSNDDLFDFVGTWHVCHADGTTEDIVLTHGNLVEDNRGTCGQFILTRRVVAGPQEPDTP